MKRINEKWNYTPHEYYFVYGVLYFKLESKEVSIDSKLQSVTKYYGDFKNYV